MALAKVSFGERGGTYSYRVFQKNLRENAYFNEEFMFQLSISSRLDAPASLWTVEPAEGFSFSDSQLISSLTLLVTVTGGVVSGVRVSTREWSEVVGSQQK